MFTEITLATSKLFLFDNLKIISEIVKHNITVSQVMVTIFSGGKKNAEK